MQKAQTVEAVLGLQTLLKPSRRRTVETIKGTGDTAERPWAPDEAARAEATVEKCKCAKAPDAPVQLCRP